LTENRVFYYKTFWLLNNIKYFSTNFQLERCLPAGLDLQGAKRVRVEDGEREGGKGI